MLRSLTVNNFALIRNMQFMPEQGLNVITGETGAGKSIMLGALGLVLGNRADSTVIDPENEKCVVEAVFVNTAPNVHQYINQNNLDDGDEVILRREISSSGKSRAFINDTPVTLNELRELGSLLIEIHTQNTSLLIREPGMQLQLLDDFGTEKLLLQHHFENWTAYSDVKGKLAGLRETVRQAQQERDYVQFQFDELDRLKPVAGEETQLEEKSGFLGHAAEIGESTGKVADMLFESETSAYNIMSSARSLLKNITGYNQDIRQVYEKLDGMMVELKELSQELLHIAGQSDTDPEELERVQQRLASLQQLMRKHDTGNTEGLVALYEALGEKLLISDQAGEQLVALEKEVDMRQKACITSAEALHEARNLAAIRLSGEAEAILHKLGMPKARLKVHLVFDHNKLNQTGATVVQLLFNADGHTELPLDKVASGGEVSRLNFCFKSLVARNRQLPTIVFDEVDTGVSGEVALKFGELMKSMGERHQVVTITHLPQVAANGTVHFLVYKEEEKGKTITRLKKLHDAERISNIASMLSGKDPGEAALANAKALLGLN